jgi:hypothetical protein
MNPFDTVTTFFDTLGNLFQTIFVHNFGFDNDAFGHVLIMTNKFV